ncbi:hypothetical protein Y032_0005g2496 [Ancylostoma ceylanicum]|nr:hypothetical protein Y032_0005g2496 [Ancylostoma ceylanicum]
MYIQATNVVLAVCGRLAAICFATSSKRLYIFLIGLTYRLTALLLCLGGYMFLYCKTKNNAKRAELNILIHGGCLVFALSAVLCSSVFRRFQIQESSPLMRVFFLTTMLWVPSMNVIVTTFLTKGIRSRLLHPFASPQLSTTVVSRSTKGTQNK